MRLVTFVESERTRVGVLDPQRGEVVDLSVTAPGLPLEMSAVIAQGEAGLSLMGEAAASAEGRLPVDAVRVLAPLPRPPRNVFCVGKNYRDHVTEVRAAGSALGGGDESGPRVPIIFTKATTAVIGPGAPIPGWLDPTRTVDYEGELAVVIGKGGRGITRGEAWRHVYGYTIVNDVTSRSLQASHQQWFMGKSLDGFCPMGPVLVTRDEIPDVAALHICTRVNGEQRQAGDVGDMIFDIPALIEALSRTMTLQPGDVIATGTPAGVGMGYSPPRYLQPGDRVAVTIEGIGTLENPVQ